MQSLCEYVHSSLRTFTCRKTLPCCFNGFAKVRHPHFARQTFRIGVVQQLLQCVGFNGERPRMVTGTDDEQLTPTIHELQMQDLIVELKHEGLADPVRLKHRNPRACRSSRKMLVIWSKSHSRHSTFMLECGDFDACIGIPNARIDSPGLAHCMATDRPSGRSRQEMSPSMPH